MRKVRTKQGRKGPDFIKYFDPVIEALKFNDASARPKEVYQWIIDNLNVSDDELQRLNRNGQSNFENKVAFARFYLVKAGYIDGSTRGVWALTNKGRESSIDHWTALRIFDDVQSRFSTSNQLIGDDEESTSQIAPDDDTPIANDLSGSEDDYINRSEIESELVEALRSMSDKGFEEFCARVLRAIGFENVNTIGGSGDGGIDGVGELLVNRFMRTRVAFQCKRYKESNTISPDRVRDFRGAITGRVDRGIFLTTSRFTKAAIMEAKRENATPIELVDLSVIIEILIDERIGLSERRALVIKKDFFAQYLEQEQL